MTSRQGRIAAALALLLGILGVSGILVLRARFKRLAATLFAPPTPRAHRAKSAYEVAEAVLDGKPLRRVEGVKVGRSAHE